MNETATENTVAAIETVAPAAAVTKTRRKGVKNAAIIRAMIAASKRVNDKGEVVGTQAEVATELDMESGALSGRLTALRKAGVPVPELARSKNSGPSTKTTNEDIMNLFAEISKEFADTDSTGA